MGSAGGQAERAFERATRSDREVFAHLAVELAAQLRYKVTINRRSPGKPQFRKTATSMVSFATLAIPTWQNFS